MREIDTSCREGYAWFILDDRLYFEGCEHYLIYGSEYLQAIAPIDQNLLNVNTANKLDVVF